MRKSVNVSVCVLLISLIYSCNEWYNYPLGANLSLWEGDKKEDRAIVYCEGRCNAGIYVLPSYERHYDSSGHYAEYVIKAKANAKWVIVKTMQIKEHRENYWIISKDFNIKNLDCSINRCDSILQSHVDGPFSLNEFQIKLEKMKIDLRL